jgi:transcription elongation factor Elf1
LNEHPKWLGDLYGYIRCPACTHRYKAEEMAVLKRKGQAYLIAALCARCGAQAQFAVATNDKPEPVVEPVPTLTSDDVLDVHEALDKKPIRLKDVLQ